MSRRRRRANDFVDSLNSFRSTIYSETEFDTDTLNSISQDSLENTNIRQNALETTTCSSNHSVILACSSTKDPPMQDTPISPIATRFLCQSEPDLNKRIDLFQNQNSKSENTITCKNSGRDTNHNIQRSTSDINNVPEEIVIKDMENSKQNYMNKDEHNEVNSESADGNNAENFEILLCSLDNELNQIKETKNPEPQKILRRLSDKFINAPTNFTEKLLTIIEESVANNENDESGTPAINLSKLISEFIKECKFIEDETVPEWPLSPVSIRIMEQISNSPGCTKTVGNIAHKHEKSLMPFSTDSKSLTSTPVYGIDRNKSCKTLLSQIFKNGCHGSLNNINNLSLNEHCNGSFEVLEAQCKKLYSGEQENAQPIQKSLSEPSLLSMSDIHRICEKQMASLDSPCAIIERNNGTPKTVHKYICKNLSSNCSKKVYHGSPQTPEQYHKSKDFQCDNISYSRRKSRKIELKSGYNRAETNKITNNYINVDPDELEKTLLQDIAEKRKRCLDTAKIITEINADPTAMAAQKSLRMSPLFSEDNESNSVENNEAKFLNTLMSCKNYHTYLRKQKPLFNFLQNSSFSVPENTCDEAGSKPEIKIVTEKAILNSDKSPHIKNTNSNLPHRYCHLPKPQAKPKYFVTPGKSPVKNNCKKKPVYFPNLDEAGKSTTKKNILKSPHGEGLYRLNYNTIISPVGMYIRGTDMQLIKNVPAKTDNLLLTPIKKENKPSPAKSSGWSNFSKGISKRQEKQSLDIKLSKQSDHTNKENELTPKTPKTDHKSDHQFILPKVSYKLPLQVRTIKEKVPTKTGNRVRGLLEAAQSKVVIRHEGRINSVKKMECAGVDQDNEEFEIDYNPEDESIHIEQAACKTNFIHLRKRL